MRPLLRTAYSCTRLAPRTSYPRWHSTKQPFSIRKTTASDAPLRSGLQNAPSKAAGGLSAMRRNYNQFGVLVSKRFQLLLQEMGEWAPDHEAYRSFGIHSQSQLDREARLFLQAIRFSFRLASDKNLVGRSENPLFWNLRHAFVRGDSSGLSSELRYSFQNFLLRDQFARESVGQRRLADMRYPYEWYPTARTLQRTVHLHVGPTNSGKTYRALKALENAKTGIYAGPLRLLAHEIYSRFQAKGKPCALVTGEEQRMPEDTDAYFVSCTVEMTPLQQLVDVAVIDEIQMIADDDRGWAWTQAFLGLQARELHLCGEERTVDLITAMCARMGDQCIVHRYERLNPLHTQTESLGGSFANLQKGDAVVSFSRVSLHTLKAGIEQITGRRCAIVYGSLPPETRAQQAALFNDPNNDYDFLVASDAIGMGLNLEIKRVIFEAATKFDGLFHRGLTVPEIKQIGGRAGRYRTAARDMRNGSKPSDQDADGAAGLVTTLEEEDLARVRRAFKTTAEPIQTAGILPPIELIDQFASYYPPGTPLSFILLRLRDMAQVSRRFHFCTLVKLLEAADVIQSLPMTTHDRCVFLNAPVSIREPKQKEVFKALAACVSGSRSGELLEIREIELEVLDLHGDLDKMAPADYLRRLEELHKCVTLYLWLSYRFMGVFTSQRLAFHVKALVEDKINGHLGTLSFVPDRLRSHRVRARREADKHRKKEKQLLGLEADGRDGGGEAGAGGPGQWNEAGHEEPLVEGEPEAQAATVAQEISANDGVNDVREEAGSPSGSSGLAKDMHGAA